MRARERAVCYWIEKEVCMDRMGVLEFRHGVDMNDRGWYWVWVGMAIVAVLLLAGFLAGFIYGILWERERIARMYPDPVCDMCGRLECSAETCGPEGEMKGSGL